MIVLYTKDNCTYCDQAKTLLKLKGLEYKEISIKDDQALDYLLSLGLKTVPQIWISDKHIGGFRQLEEYFWAKALSEGKIH